MKIAGVTVHFVFNACYTSDIQYECNLYYNLAGLMYITTCECFHGIFVYITALQCYALQINHEFRYK